MSNHLPSLPAAAVFFCPVNSTVIFAPGLLQPHTGTGICRCRIALSTKGVPNSMAGLGFATSSAAFATNADSTTMVVKAKTVAALITLCSSSLNVLVVIEKATDSKGQMTYGFLTTASFTGGIFCSSIHKERCPRGGRTPWRGWLYRKKLMAAMVTLPSLNSSRMSA